MNFPQMQNPGLAPRALRDLLCLGWSHRPLTVGAMQAQLLVDSFGFSPWLAQDMAILCYGEARHD